LFPGKVALIGLGEKGTCTYVLQVHSVGGHASLPPVPQTPIGILANALARLEATQFPPQMVSFDMMVDFLLSELPLLPRVALANRGLLHPLIVSQILKSNTAAASIRTTIAPTMLSGSPKRNVLPAVAMAKITFRMLPSETSEAVKNHIIAAINDPRVEVLLEEGFTEASPITPSNTSQFRLLHRTIAETLPEYLVAPMILPGVTDSRHYYQLTSNVFRFQPQRFKKDDFPRFHGINERIHQRDVATLVRFFYRLIQNLNSPSAQEA